MASFFPTPLCHFRGFLFSGITDALRIRSLSAKVIRAHIRLPLAQIPPPFPNVSPAHWRRFWESRLPLRLYTIWWRLMHTKIPSSRQRLFSHNVTDIEDPYCVLRGELEDDEHLFWACAYKQPVLATSCNSAPYQSYLSYVLIPSPSIFSVDRAIWEAHFRYFFNNIPFVTNRSAFIVVVIAVSVSVSVSTSAPVSVSCGYSDNDNGSGS
ncbi:hypothetical protein PHYBLDRAFT_153173 [Phycomyces blakesleeanus NRRL 1555(-)]|uniref:Uncharacterized protein n=1 Tax=Phycomyces blakesleeanus (strain ATCC 8743b / DSM 1359 / FGSC 10004 / NBRC 33097 / NRRL 1555) TaxID=763407 RepID=A0A167JC96_PHYB8|nr:hypothetical protein PHYBLDRAFT_153173 [Phycomyces blakesleeanus NRRL 1555(-)]OAD65697.1 hypothetical protein PHYBLDRAFT_153173 [Phycomyces blakesleeanus NRRL 1555(-)]|eukprot:XP_018283737.1 hypothetical protein PHYBLDRAFT_153173 [Phycomyces blakesleeanus NRRL 1555(-)]